MSRASRYRVRFWDPEGERYGTPTYPWRMAPDGLATRRQLRAAGLCPGGRPPAAQIMWRGVGGDRVAYLYMVELAKPKRVASPAVRAALDKAMAARRWCPQCREDVGYDLPRRWGCCWRCAEAS